MEKAFTAFLWIGLAVAVANALHVLRLGLTQPLLDLYSFRQTQTAITVYWLLHGGPWITYETPVLGAPWSIPYEFPVYQWIVVVLIKTGIPLETAGRLVSFAFYLCTLWPLHTFFRAVRLPRTAFLATAILFMTAPLYLYWSRTFLMESCALFFSCLALALITVFLRDRRPSLAIEATIAGSIAAVTKITTLPAFSALAGCLILLDLGMRLRAERSRAQLKHAVIPGLAITFPYLIGFSWVYYSDQIKLANEFGSYLTSASLYYWNLGTLAQRLSAQLWINTIQDRALHDLFGPAALLAATAAGAALIRPRFALGAILAALGFLIPFLVFTNLHIVHSYYQYANGVFALAAVGIGVASIVEGQQRYQYFIAAGVLACLIIAQISFYRAGYRPYLVRDYSQDRIYRIAALARERTPPDSSLIVIGDDWSSEIPYYAQRKSLMLAAWFPVPLFAKVFEKPQAFLDDRPLGGIVYCGDQLPKYVGRELLVESFVAGRAVLGEFGGCQLLSANRQ